MPALAIDTERFPQIRTLSKCPTGDDGHHVELAAMMLHLATIGLQPVTASLGCGCKLKCSDIPSQLRNAKREHPLRREKPGGGKNTSPRARMSKAEKRKRFDEAQLSLWPRARRRR